MLDHFFDGVMLLPFLLMTTSVAMAQTKYEKATFAGGCFWCMEPPFQKTKGVIDVLSGYTGGTTEKPTYDEVTSGSTGHLESIEVTFDPKVVSYADLVELFWTQIDPTDSGGQFVDRGSHYHTAIFVHTDEQKKIATASKEALEKSGKFNKPIATLIRPAQTFYKAEDYHQDFYKINPLHYKRYRASSGRDEFIDKTWVKKAETPPPAKPAQCALMTDEELRKKLSPLQYEITKKNGTERPFENAYWDNHREGIYVDVISGEALFSSIDKFDSGTGWPSFTRPLNQISIIEKGDNSLLQKRTEVRSKQADSHLGHVFDDGPGPTKRRYCINSASLRFIPKEDLEKEGYGDYLKLFEKK